MATHDLKKLELLAGRIARVVERFEELSAKYEMLREKNSSLSTELDNLRNHNNTLSQRLVEMEAAGAGRGEQALEENHILDKIDRMLEKFGELQI